MLHTLHVGDALSALAVHWLCVFVVGFDVKFVLTLGENLWTALFAGEPSQHAAASTSVASVKDVRRALFRVVYVTARTYIAPPVVHTRCLLAMLKAKLFLEPNYNAGQNYTFITREPLLDPLLSSQKCWYLPQCHKQQSSMSCIYN